MANYPKIIPLNPSYLEHWFCCSILGKTVIVDVKIIVGIYLSLGEDTYI